MARSLCPSSNTWQHALREPDQPARVYLTDHTLAIVIFALDEAGLSIPVVIVTAEPT